MNFRGVIFDLDGTLVNSLEDLADSMNTVLLSFKFPVHDLSAYKTFIGNGIMNLVKVSLPESEREEATISECYKLMTEIYNNNCLNKTKPYEGITDLLSELKSLNMKLGVLSNKADEFTKKIVQTLIPGCFDEIAGLISETHKKPDPYGALQISKKFGFSPDEMIYLGDSCIDMKTANNAGMYAVGALWGFRTKEELIASGARHVVSYPADLLNILKTA